MRLNLQNSMCRVHVVAMFAMASVMAGVTNAAEPAVAPSATAQQSINFMSGILQSAKSFQPTVVSIHSPVVQYSVTGMTDVLTSTYAQEDELVIGEENGAAPGDESPSDVPMPDLGNGAVPQPQPEVGAPVMGGQPGQVIYGGDCGCQPSYGAPGQYGDPCGNSYMPPAGVPSMPYDPGVSMGVPMGVPMASTFPSTPMSTPMSPPNFVQPGGGFDLSPAVAAPSFVMPGQGMDFAPSAEFSRSMQYQSYSEPAERRIHRPGCLQRLFQGCRLRHR